MIDWIGVGSNALWILGCAIGLGTLSYASWEASVYNEKFTARLSRAPILACLNLAGFLFSLGLAATSDTAIERILWLVPTIAFGGLLIYLVILPRLRR
jgi:hypothetical protein